MTFLLSLGPFEARFYAFAHGLVSCEQFLDVDASISFGIEADGVTVFGIVEKEEASGTWMRHAKTGDLIRFVHRDVNARMLGIPPLRTPASMSGVGS